jgi:hypothetical protein
MKINTKGLEGTWTKFKGLDLKIRPAAASSNPFTLGNQETLTLGDYMWSVFDNCLVDWKNVVDDDDKAIEFNPENKRMLFDYIDGIADHVEKESNKLRKAFNKELKN